MFGSSKYNYESFRKEFSPADTFKAFQTSGEARPGDFAPEFEGRTSDGAKFRLKSLRERKNLVLTFGSATCPFTTSSIRGLNRLYHEFEDEDVDFLFVYVREAHPGERIPAHTSFEEKERAAKIFRSRERLDIPVLVDYLDGRIHRAYGAMPNSTCIIDKSGRISFRSSYTRPKTIDRALNELLDLQEDRETSHAIILGGEDVSVPIARGLFHTHRALGRGGSDAIRTYREQMGRVGMAGEVTSRIAEPLALYPARAATAALLGAVFVLAGLLLGRRLRKERYGSLREPYNYGSRGENSEYAVGI